ncbi:MAG: hypothetical protein WCC06_06665 [Candidatus Aminicenantales bacterium]
MKKFSLSILCIFLLAECAAAIPAFARKYGYSCEVCHAPVPHLKAFGEDFMDNGYRIPEKEPPRATIDTGDPILLLQRELPLAFRFDGYLAYEFNADVRPDIKSPFVMKILSGGNISNTISYYTYFLLTEEGKIAGLEDTYLIFRNVFGLPVSIAFGQYRISDPIKPTETRLTFEEYRIYKFRVGQSQISLSYDRGIMGSAGTNFGTDFVFQVVNGNGIDNPDIFDTDKYKSFVWRVAQSFSQKSIRFGILGYHGKEDQGGTTNTVSYLGPDLRLRLPKVELMLQYVRRTDSNPLFSSDGQKHSTDAYFGELIFSPQGDKGRWFFTFAYNQVKSCFDEANYQRVTVNASYLLRRNMRWMSEYTHDLDGKDHRFLTGIMVGI